MKGRRKDRDVKEKEIEDGEKRERRSRGRHEEEMKEKRRSKVEGKRPWALLRDKGLITVRRSRAEYLKINQNELQRSHTFIKM